MDLQIFLMELGVILFLAFINGFLAMSEMAMVSSKIMKLQKLAENGSKGAEKALQLISEPSRFLAAIQIGITLIGVFAGAFGGSKMSEIFSQQLKIWGVPAEISYSFSIFTIVLTITFLNLLFGELIPKRVALTNPEGIAQIVSKPMEIIAKFSKPIVIVLSYLTEYFVKLLRIESNGSKQNVFQEEISMLVEQGGKEGVIDEQEQTILKKTLKLKSRYLYELMTPRTELQLLDLSVQQSKNFEILSQSNHTYFPVVNKHIDHVIGILSIKKLLSDLISNSNKDIQALMDEPLFVPENLKALHLLEKFRETGKHFAVVVDEYGGLAGAVSAIDLLEAIVGDIPNIEINESPSIVMRHDGSWLVDGSTKLEDIAEAIGMNDHVLFQKNDTYETIAGLALSQFGKIPKTGDCFAIENWRFEILDKDGHRIDKLLIESKV